MFTNDLISLIDNAGIATFGADLFCDDLPDTPDNALAVYTSPGRAPGKWDGCNYPAAQIVARSADQDWCRAKLKECFDLLHNQELVWVNGRYYIEILADSDAERLDPDKKERCKYVQTYRADVAR
jgi:DNA modification methylase